MMMTDENGNTWWACDICKHTEKHIPHVFDETGRPKGCLNCPRCKASRASVQPVIPRGLMR